MKLLYLLCYFSKKKKTAHELYKQKKKKKKKMGFLGECFEGLLEGHESPGYRTFYRLFMFSFIVFTIVASVLPVTSNDGAVMLAVLHMTTVLVMMCMTFILIRWYRVDGMLIFFYFMHSL